jgi:hypothetical protein
MASNKANTLHPPQTINSQLASGPMPVKAHIYHSLAELNAAFDTVINEFGNLKQLNYICSEPLTAMYHQLLRIRAQANREFTTVLHEREAANANHFENLYGQSTLPAPQIDTQ